MNNLEEAFNRGFNKRAAEHEKNQSHLLRNLGLGAVGLGAAGGLGLLLHRQMRDPMGFAAEAEKDLAAVRAGSTDLHNTILKSTHGDDAVERARKILAQTRHNAATVSEYMEPQVDEFNKEIDSDLLRRAVHHFPITRRPSGPPPTGPLL